MSESRNDISAAPTHQLPLNDNEQQTPLHSYLTHALPNIQVSEVYTFLILI